MSRASKNLLDRTFQSSRAANRSHQVSDRSLKQKSPLTQGGQLLVCLHEQPFSELHGLSRPGRRRPRRNRRWLRQRCSIYPSSQRFWRSRRCWRGREQAYSRKVRTCCGIPTARSDKHSFLQDCKVVARMVLGGLPHEYRWEKIAV
jgi:hypothetical protein